MLLDFPGGSDGKASAYNVGDPGSIPGLGRSPGEENGHPSSTLAWKIPGRGVAKSRVQPTDFTFTFHLFATELDISCGLVLCTL